jgi:replication initiation and membrane attachment protein DnaB
LTFSGADAICRLSLLFNQQKVQSRKLTKTHNCSEKQAPTQTKKKTPRASTKKQKAKNEEEEEEDGRRQQYLL